MVNDGHDDFTMFAQSDGLMCRNNQLMSPSPGYVSAYFGWLANESMGKNSRNDIETRKHVIVFIPLFKKP